jgi:Tol biopolymer transport system component
LPLAPGARLGPYEILSPLGAGGMGEVYRARDTRLDRDVAIKILPAAFASDSDRIARFQREAKTLAALNHSNIAQVFGLEQVGDSHALVMELVAGEDLSDRIARGPIPIDEALAIARQIAEALEAAHEQGIIHRDLKPANIKLRADGTVKVLDFGLAKMLEPVTASISASVTNSPTITTPAMMTGIGMILGTAAYMSPEQAKGRPADKRSDVWAFGCVLFEMLTAQRAFGGEDASDTLAAVLRAEPGWTALPAPVPKHIQTLVRCCLEKDRKDRIADISTIRFLMNEGSRVFAAPTTDVPGLAAVRHGAVPWKAATALLLVTSLTALGGIVYIVRSASHSVTRFIVDAPANTTFVTGGRPATSAVISPDGQKIAFTARDAAGKISIWVRSLESLTAQPLMGTDEAQFPFWSPDSRFIAYFGPDKLLKVAASGGPPQTVCAVNGSRGGAWGRDGVIVFGSNGAANGENTGLGLFRVSADGGQPVSATRSIAGQQDQRFPSFLPDGRHVLFYVNSTSPDVAGIWVGSIETGESKRLLEAESSGFYDVVSHQLLFVRQGTLMAQAFNVRSLALLGEPVPVVERVEAAVFAGALTFSSSDGGVLVYGQGQSRTINANGFQLAWVDRKGKRIEAVGPPAQYRGIDVSPDDKRVGAHRHDGAGGDVWVTEPSPGPTSRFTFDASQENSSPIWSRDGSHLAFASVRHGKYGIYQKPANGAGSDELLLESKQPIFPQSWSPDGQSLVYMESDAKTRDDLHMVPLSGDRKPVPLVNSPFLEQDGQVSPNGRWLAYSSNETNRGEIYVRPFPSGAGKWQVSTNGGGWPRWRGDGRELFFVILGTTAKLAAVQTKPDGSTFEHGAPTDLFDAVIAVMLPGGFAHPHFMPYAVSRDGQRFLLPQSPPLLNNETGPRSVVVVVNWMDALRK